MSSEFLKKRKKEGKRKSEKVGDFANERGVDGSQKAAF